MVNIASYSTSEELSKGRKYKEPKHPFRGEFQRDVARIIHSRPFRRLEYKTQVFINGVGDHYRTRLTHTIEVASIARTIARTLSLNEDLTEAISLAHDLGHPPFGHMGEKVLNNLLQKLGLSFEHNFQSLRIVDLLIEKYPNFKGLNLMWETRCGLLKHRKNKIYLDGVLLPNNPSLEAQVADIADDLAYLGHDLDDGLYSSLITIDRLNKLKIWNRIIKELNRLKVKTNNKQYIPFAIRTLIDIMVSNIINNTKNRLEKMNIKTQNDVLNCKSKIVTFSNDITEEVSQLKNFLYNNLYYNYSSNHIRENVENIITFLFENYTNNPNLMPKSTTQNIDRFGLYRTIADYISGMTDRFALLEYKRLRNII